MIRSSRSEGEFHPSCRWVEFQGQVAVGGFQLEWHYCFTLFSSQRRVSPMDIPIYWNKINEDLLLNFLVATYTWHSSWQSNFDGVWTRVASAMESTCGDKMASRDVRHITHSHVTCMMWCVILARRTTSSPSISQQRFYIVLLSLTWS